MAEPQNTPEPVAVPLPTEIAGWLSAYRRARDKVRHWANAAEVAQKHVTELLDEAGANVGTVNGHPAVRWTRIESRRVDGTRLRTDHPELAEEYSTLVVSHRFTTPHVPVVDGSA